MSSTTSSGKESFEDFYSEVKEIEKRDSVLTPKQQIERLLRPGSTYFNLNPFEVLQVDPENSLEEIKKKYRRLSILVHPDKNIDDSERAQQAFEIINRAWKTLENEETRKKCLDIYEEAKERTDHMVTDSTVVCHPCWTLALNCPHHSTATNDNKPSTSGGHHRRVCVSCGCSLIGTRSHRLHTDTERDASIHNIITEMIMPRQIEQKRKKQKKDGRVAEGIPEDDPEKYKHAVYVMTMKLFADMERKRQHLETRDMEERKRKREAEIEQEEQMSFEKEWAKNFEESRQNRVDSWKSFQSGSKEKKKKKIMGFKPPKPKPESR